MAQRYDLEPVLAAMKVIADFNALDLTVLDLYHAGKPVPVDPPVKEEFIKYACLSNTTFVEHDVLPLLKEIR